MRALLPEADDALPPARWPQDTSARSIALRDQRRLVDEPLFEGIAERSRRWRRDGWLLGVATGKSDRGLAHVLAHHGLDRSLRHAQTADRHPSKPDPAMLLAAMAEAGAAPARRRAMIGDTSFDMAMARGRGRARGRRRLGLSRVRRAGRGGRRCRARRALPALLEMLA